jgi:predicted O-methyltransferase YrrM
MNPDDPRGLLVQIDSYVEGLFAPPDPALEAVLRRSREAGLPKINVSPNEGRLLQLLAEIAGARRILEIGTLGGYSTIHLARALSQRVARRLILVETAQHESVLEGPQTEGVRRR